MFVCLVVCMCIYLSTCLFWSVIFFSFIGGKKMTGLCWGQYTCSNIVGCRIIAHPHVCLCSDIKSFGLYTLEHFPVKKYTLCIFWWVHMLFMLISRVQKEPLYLLFFFFFFFTSATQHCTLRTNQLFSSPEKSVLETEDETKLGFMWLTHFEGPHSYLQITYCTFFFSYCDDNCVSPDKPPSDGFPRRRLFGES